MNETPDTETTTTDEPKVSWFLNTVSLVFLASLIFWFPWQGFRQWLNGLHWWIAILSLGGPLAALDMLTRAKRDTPIALSMLPLAMMAGYLLLQVRYWPWMQ